MTCARSDVCVGDSRLGRLNNLVNTRFSIFSLPVPLALAICPPCACCSRVPVERPGTPALTSSTINQPIVHPTIVIRYPQPVASRQRHGQRAPRHAPSEARAARFPSTRQPATQQQQQPFTPRTPPPARSPDPHESRNLQPVTTLTRLLSRALTRSPRPNRSCRARCAPPWPRS